VTIAIGMYFMGGMIVCADTNIVSDDGIVISGGKLHGAECRNRTYVIANSGNDANASTMLAKEILDDLSNGATDQWNIEPIIKKRMMAWHASYTHGTPPATSFILAANTGLQHRQLYVCEPPSTVRAKQLGEAITIGIGGQIVDPLIPSVVTGAVPVKIALLQLAYLMYRAKRDQIFLRGSDTDAMVVTTDGKVLPVSRSDMKDAEEIGRLIDDALQICFMGMLGQTPFPGTFLQAFQKIYQECEDKCREIEFRSLKETDSFP
jgi:hypothetical protein